uniref:Uncharacterized protein n=1 Tax=Arundo donax TaxID=35708 RepID=A0A0A9HA91_ARUDO
MRRLQPPPPLPIPPLALVITR